MTNILHMLASADAHIAVVDALLRFGAGTDDGDVATLKSAFADDAAVDFSACGRALGLDFERLQGVGTIAAFLGSTSQRQLTSHVVSNPRVHLKDGRAHLRALIDATHVARADPTNRFRMMNWYDIDLVSVGGLWRIERMAIENIWFEGNPHILLLR